MFIEAVQLNLDEYVDEDGLTVTQASGKIIEEDWQNINTSDFIKYSYLVNLALEGIKRKQLPDFLYEKFSHAGEAISKIENNESEELKSIMLRIIFVTANSTVNVFHIFK
ncbi:MULTISPECIES: hypothetical protein [unclassified Bacillus (in: firmicutes)]|uniref:hypothetical protein n=1 Tax=unclassified Bacillus (in: firmicutes) TaxID=185979 RepID=UPI0008E46323|nr:MULTISPECIES: hypothetical protein [unclassified Bacillus (in: firmicutes)]SFI06105.1 hypothetical protein SAMN04488574_101447 [Bacillus sp. 71mf]SFS79038.1 hypothetical protein SAMN04488145_103330 [Bacillus sp. 103mf]